MKNCNNSTATFTTICVLLVSLCGIGLSDENTDAVLSSDFYTRYYQDNDNQIAGK